MSENGKQVGHVEILRDQLGKMTTEFRAALPSHISADKFQRVVMTVVQMNPDLVVADRRSLLASCLKCAADGLVPDGREAALVIFNTKVKRGDREEWVKAVQYMPMMAGLLKRLRNTGEVASVEAHCIYEHDHFVWRQGTEGGLEHKPLFPGDRGQMIGAYAVARFKDGSPPQFEVMDKVQLEKVRNASRSKDRGPWKDWYEEMARKSVFRRLAKWLPTSADTAVVREDEDIVLTHEEERAIENVTSGPRVALPAPGDRLSVLESLPEAEVVTIDAAAEAA